MKFAKIFLKNNNANTGADSRMVNWYLFLMVAACVKSIPLSFDPAMSFLGIDLQ